MKIYQNARFLTGKIKFWNNPIFDLDQFHKQGDALRNSLETKLNLELNPVFVKPPTRNTILGNTKETYRFNFGKPIQNLNYIDHIDVGFGESGYYYDIYLQKIPFEKETWQKLVHEVQEYQKSLEYRVEHALQDFQLASHSNLADRNNLSVSNFTCALKGDHPNDIIQKIFPRLTFLQEEAEIHTEGFFFSQETDDGALSQNFVIPEFRMNIFPQKVLDSPKYAKKYGQFLNLERHLTISPLDSIKNLWEINVRGIGMEMVGKIIQTIFFSDH